MAEEHMIRKLHSLIQQEGNNVCADCSREGPEWASYNLGVFLCIDCSGYHRMLGSHISRIKSIKLDSWNEDLMEVLIKVGNKKAKERYEQSVPVCYPKPMFDDPPVMKEQWIRAKYERLEFQDISKQRYLTGYKEGYLMKRAKNDSKFNLRYFELSEQNNSLKYYIKSRAGEKDDKDDPKAEMRLSEIKAVLNPIKIGNPNGLQISYIKNGTTRNIYVYSDDGKEIIDWYVAIQSSLINWMRTAFPTLTDSALVERISRNFSKEGYLFKTGPKAGDVFRKRWFTLDGRRMMYFSDPLDPYPKGEVFICHESDGYNVAAGPPEGRDDEGFTFTLITPGRSFYMRAESQEEVDEWISLINVVTNKIMSPQDNLAASNIERKRSVSISRHVSGVIKR